MRDASGLDVNGPLAPLRAVLSSMLCREPGSFHIAMFFNLGLTADAAAAHQHEFSSPQTVPQNTTPTSPTSPTSPTASSYIAFPALPSLPSSLPSFSFTCPFSASTPWQNFTEPLGMSSNPGSTRPSTSDDDYSGARSDPAAESRPVRPTSVRTHSQRARTSFQLAHPPRNPLPKRLRIRPKLLLQLQQISQTSRPIPTLDVLPSITFVPRLARKFPTIFKGKDGLGPNDLIIVNSDTYDRLGLGDDERSVSSEDEPEDQREVVATICQILKEDARQKGKADIRLNHGSPWEATPLPNGSYEFVAQTEQGIRTVRWVLRGKKDRRLSAPAGISSLDDHKRFTFSVIDPTTRRHPVIASMTRRNIDVYHQYSIPSASNEGYTSPLSPTSVMSMSNALADVDDPSNNVIETDDNLRTLIIITGIWVAFREGWSQDFMYNDLMSGAGSGNMTSPIRSSTLAALTPPKRTNSTGAAFMERANRRSASAASARTNRHTVFAGSSEQATHVSPDPVPSRQLPSDLNGCPDKRRSKLGPESQSDMDTFDEGRDQPQSRGRTLEAPQSRPVGESRPRTADKGSGKSKRWRRLSNILDFVSKKNSAR